jgi:hypothetical protein
VNDTAIPELSGLGRAALVVGALGVAASLAGAWLDPAQFFRSYLVAYLYVASLSLGCLAVLMVYNLTGGSWGVAIRRPLEAAAGLIPLLVVLFVPLVLGLTSLYRWTSRATMMADEELRLKIAYLNEPAFIGRAVFYFAVWLTLAFLMIRWSRAQDRTGDPRYADHMQKLSGIGVVIVGFTVTFAAFDWAMSLDPKWYSTIYGMAFFAEQGLGAMAFAVAVAYLLGRRTDYAQVLKPTVLNDLGNLMLAFVMVWAYLAFSQLLIIWAGNLPEEIRWYLRRISGGWEFVAGGLALFYFAVPFAVLLGRGNKRQHRRLAALAVGVLAVRAVHMFFLVAPEFSPARLTAHWLDLATLAGLGGLWTAMFVRRLGTLPLLAPNDPLLPGTLARKH